MIANTNHVVVLVMALTLIKLAEKLFDLQLEPVAQLHEEHLSFDRLELKSKTDQREFSDRRLDPLDSHSKWLI